MSQLTGHVWVVVPVDPAGTASVILPTATGLCSSVPSRRIRSAVPEGPLPRRVVSDIHAKGVWRWKPRQGTTRHATVSVTRAL